MSSVTYQPDHEVKGEPRKSSIVKIADIEAPVYDSHTIDALVNEGKKHLIIQNFNVLTIT